MLIDSSLSQLLSDSPVSKSPMTSSPEAFLGLTPDWWSAVATSVGALATFFAVLVALAIPILQWRKDRQREERLQAEKISVWFSDEDDVSDPANLEENFLNEILCPFVVNNASTQPIYDMVVEVVGLQGAIRRTAIGDTIENNEQYMFYYDTIPPGQTKARIDTGGGGMGIRHALEVAFTDVAGTHWVRSGNGILRASRVDAVDLFGLSRPLSVRADRFLPRATKPNA
jgi:heme exporter protein D